MKITDNNLHFEIRSLLEDAVIEVKNDRSKQRCEQLGTIEKLNKIFTDFISRQTEYNFGADKALETVANEELIKIHSFLKRLQLNGGDLDDIILKKEDEGKNGQ